MEIREKVHGFGHDPESARVRVRYAFMQAVGMVNDHLVTCWRHGELAEESGR